MGTLTKKQVQDAAQAVLGSSLTVSQAALGGMRPGSGTDNAKFVVAPGSQAGVNKLHQQMQQAQYRRLRQAQQQMQTAQHQTLRKQPLVVPEELKLRQMPHVISWYNEFIATIDCILAKKELSIDQLTWVPGFAGYLDKIVDFGGKSAVYEGFKNSFWRCIHRVDSLIFQDYEFMKQLRRMLCAARRMKRPDVGKTWEEVAEEEDESRKNTIAAESLPPIIGFDYDTELAKLRAEEKAISDKLQSK